MKAIYLIAGLCFALCQFAYGQECPEGYLFIYSQEDLDNFLIDYPDCTELQSVIIHDATLTNLDGLAGIQTIEWTLQLSEVSGLTSLSDLEGLTSLGALVLADNPDLVSLDGLENVADHVFEIWIAGNPALESISALQGISTVSELLIAGNDALSGLDGLHNITRANVNVSIMGQAISSLSGLANLQTTRRLSLAGMPLITSLEELSSLDTILFDEILLLDMDGLVNLEGLDLKFLGGNFMIEDCDQLQAIGDFENTTFAMGELRIRNNPLLQDLQGLEGVGYLGSLRVTGNAAFSSFHGLQNLVEVSGVIDIQHNPALLDFSGLASLKEMAFRNYIIENENLTSFNGLASIENVYGFLHIKNNPLLASIDALEPLTFLQFLEISGNPNLEWCSILPICEGLTSGASFSIFDNGSNCSDEQTILDLCADSYNSFSGQAFLDIDCDGNFGNGDYPLVNHLVFRSPQDFPIAFSDSAGAYFGFMPFETTWLIYPDEVYGFSPVPPDHTITTDTSLAVYDSLDFAFCPDSLFIDFQIDITSSNLPRPGFSHYYEICFKNVGSVNSACTVSLDFSGLPSGDDVTILDPDGGVVSGTNIEWMVNDPGLFQQNCFTVFVEMDPNTPLGSILLPVVMVVPPTGSYDAHPADNSDQLYQEVVGSYDPNDKSYYPEDYNLLNYQNGEALEYLIRFQNTGTYPATFIEVLDTIAANLDLSTFRMISASHDYTLTFPAERVLKWRFNKINLPDSTSNEPESHGFIKFSIEPVEGLALNEAISNRCGIYFDFNEPVITNYATMVLKDPASVFSSELNSLDFELYPNPTRNRVTIQTEQDQGPSQILLYDHKGRLIQIHHKNLGVHRTELSLNQVPSGFYFLKIITGNAVGVRKLVVE